MEFIEDHQYRGSKIEPFDKVRLLTHNGIWNAVGTVRHRYENGDLDVAVPHPEPNVSKVCRIFKVREDQVERVAVYRVSTDKGTMAEAVEVFKKANAAGRRLAGLDK